MAEAEHEDEIVASIKYEDESSFENATEKPLSESWRQEPLSIDESGKVARIIQACHDRDVVTLCELARTDGGFIEDEMRRRACASCVLPQQRRWLTQHRAYTTWKRLQRGYCGLAEAPTAPRRKSSCIRRPQSLRLLSPTRV